MKHTSIRGAVRAATLVAALAATHAATAASFITNSANLPPPGVYLSTDIHALYAGPALQVLLKRPEHAAIVAEIQRRNNGADEEEFFQSTLRGAADVTPQGQPTIPDVPVNAMGPVHTIVRGKVGQTTGTFDTEMLQLDLMGTAGGVAFMIRESPTKASTGRTKITDVGGGNFQIDSFFDVFTELSLDNGATWIPAAAPAHVVLQPNHPNAIPTVSEWGLIILALLLLTVGTIYIRRQRHALAPVAAV